MRPQLVLLDCPFCGCKPEVRAGNDFAKGLRYWIHCTRCSASVKKETKYQAVEQWNRRVVIGEKQ